VDYDYRSLPLVYVSMVHALLCLRGSVECALLYTIYSVYIMCTHCVVYTLCMVYSTHHVCCTHHHVVCTLYTPCGVQLEATKHSLLAEKDAVVQEKAGLQQQLVRIQHEKEDVVTERTSQ